MTQATLAAPFAFDGVGLHTGAQARVEVRPAPEDAGLVFALGADAFEVPALAEYVTDTSRATVVGRDGRTVSTVEHLLSALFGMGVTNATIAVDGPEIPVTDGSGKQFVDLIETAGLRPQPAPRRTMKLDVPYYLRDGERLIAALPSDGFRIRFLADFPAPVGTQYYDGPMTPSVYRADICGARTFGYLHEVEALRARGLARGGSLENAIVFDANGPMRPLRWPNEVVRHKVLDLLGDLALLGAWPQFEIVAIKSGHALHAAAALALRKGANP
ncbi:MAG TPA: UDP-3-O-acyl-N-acetylglucosamine deacetylase [Candidatus Baltobacteraceae bacterium]|jgi:UDP-3-O-[3-hydroxymyristoyl] N-acetylglucosamine deacetylase